MKKLLGTLAAVGLAASIGDAFAKGGGHSDSEPPPPPAHHSGSAPAAAPIGVRGSPTFTGGGVPRNFSGSGVYRPMTTVTGSGQRTLVYPGVRNSTLRQPANLNANGVRTGSGKVSSSSAIATTGKRKLDPQTSARLRNWTGGRSSTAQARQINSLNAHHHHGKNWWRRHCAAIIFFDWGWWGWYDGWWYPAWGYDPYSNYEYNQPIYGANGLEPDQIVAGVQAKLQQLGYYTYAIDGKMGPHTQSAIARFQRDHRMSITSGIDQPTLTSLGIIR